METSKETSSNLIRKYQRYLKLEKGYSPNTLDAYIRDVDKLLKFLSDEDIAIVPSSKCCFRAACVCRSLRI